MIDYKIGDCLELMKELDENSIDCIVTDPPYGYSFMGLDWDKALPSEDALKECCRVLKPGAFGFFMCTPRQDLLSRMIIRLEDAGFKTGFTSLWWTYATGFPKAADMSKLVDKKMGADREKVRVEYSGNALYRMGGNNTRPWMEKALEKGYHLADSEEPATPEAQSLNGAYTGFQPKPAVEPVIVVMKPLSEKTYVDQALKNGKGVTWLGNCKIPYKSDKDKESARFGAQMDIKGGNLKNPNGVLAKNVLSSENGRFPANVLCSDKILNESSKYFDLDAWFTEKIKQLPESVQKTYPYLIVPKPSKKEKGVNNTHPTVKPIKLMTYLITLGSREQDLILDPYAGSGTVGEAGRLINRNVLLFEKEPEYEPIIKERALMNYPELSTFGE